MDQASLDAQLDKISYKPDYTISAKARTYGFTIRIETVGSDPDKLLEPMLYTAQLDYHDDVPVFFAIKDCIEKLEIYIAHKWLKLEGKTT